MATEDTNDASDDALGDDASDDALEDDAPQGDHDAAGDVPEWLAALHPMLPEVLHAPYDPGQARFCFRKLGPSEHIGLLVFADPARAEAYSAQCLARHGYREVRRLSLDEACDTARDHSLRVDSVLLIDDPWHPVIQSVR